MSNCLLTLRWTLDVSEERLEALMGRPDDDSEEWYQEAAVKAQEWAQDDLQAVLHECGGVYEPEVECS